jgi:hypothetical protein
MADVDAFLVIGIVVLFLLALVANVYGLVHMQQTNDKNQSYAMKAVVLLGMQLALFTIFLLPIDVTNEGENPECDPDSLLSNSSDAYCGGLNMYFAWGVTVLRNSES